MSARGWMDVAGNECREDYMYMYLYSYLFRDIK